MSPKKSIYCGSIAFPLISAGVFGCPAEIAIRAATTAIRAFLADHEMEVYLVISPKILEKLLFSHIILPLFSRIA